VRAPLLRISPLHQKSAPLLCISLLFIKKVRLNIFINDQKTSLSWHTTVCTA
jgi:hypothetical protein